MEHNMDENELNLLKLVQSIKIKNKVFDKNLIYEYALKYNLSDESVKKCLKYFGR
jgi:ribosome biogenesis GTPase A